MQPNRPLAAVWPCAEGTYIPATIASPEGCLPTEAGVRLGSTIARICGIPQSYDDTPASVGGWQRGKPKTGNGHRAAPNPYEVPGCQETNYP